MGQTIGSCRLSTINIPNPCGTDDRFPSSVNHQYSQSLWDRRSVSVVCQPSIFPILVGQTIGFRRLSTINSQSLWDRRSVSVVCQPSIFPILVGQTISFRRLSTINSQSLWDRRSVSVVCQLPGRRGLKNTPRRGATLPVEFLHENSPAEGPSQQTTKSDRLSHPHIPNRKTSEPLCAPEALLHWLCGPLDSGPRNFEPIGAMACRNDRSPSGKSGLVFSRLKRGVPMRR